jgi:hypothetical protein
MDLRRSGRVRGPAEKSYRHQPSCEKPLTPSFDIRQRLAGPRELWWPCFVINAAKYSRCIAFCSVQGNVDLAAADLMQMKWMRIATSDAIVAHVHSPLSGLELEV